MKTIKKQQVFYSVKGAIVEGADRLGRGIYDNLARAKEDAGQYAEWEIWRHSDIRGERESNIKIYDSSLIKK
jgi:hypothetical protein